MAEVESVEEVQFYSSKTKNLSKTQVEKALKFVELGKIVYDQLNKRYLCLPIDGYNTRTYELERAPENHWGWRCNCQGWVSKSKKETVILSEGVAMPGPEGAFCSHVHALHFNFSAINKARGWGKYKPLAVPEAMHI